MIKPLTEQEEESYTIFVDSHQRALEWSAVLESQNIPYDIQKTPGNESCLFILGKNHYNSALENIKAYEKERPLFERFRKLFTSTPAPLRLKTASSSFFFCLLISLFYFISGPSSSGSEWQSKGMLSNKFFSESAWWTPVTALTLHADIPHLTGNMIFFLIFGTAAAAQAGAGVSLFFIILSGIAANLSTLAVFGDKIYNAIGFSTSVFGVLGILTTLRLMQNVKFRKFSSFYFWIPLVSALAIFGLTGGSAGSDLAGHFFGFLWGAVSGIPLHFLAKFRKNIILQTFFYCLALGIITYSWHEALK